MPRPPDVFLRRERFARRLIFERKHKRRRPKALPLVFVKDTFWFNVSQNA